MSEYYRSAHSISESFTLPRTVGAAFIGGDVSMQKMMELQRLLGVRVNGIKHTVCERMDELGFVAKEAGCALVKTLGDDDDAGQIGKVDSYVHKLVDSELLVEIGRLKAYVEVRREIKALLAGGAL